MAAASILAARGGIPAVALVDACVTEWRRHLYSLQLHRRYRCTR